MYIYRYRMNVLYSGVPMKMNFRKTVIGLGGLVALPFFFACSDTSNSADVAEKGDALSSLQVVDAFAAKTRLALCSRDVEHFWDVAGMEGSDTLSVVVDESFIENSFAVEADAVIESTEGYMTLASAGVDGSKDAWALRVEQGKPFFAWRDASTNGEWFRLDAELELPLGEMVTVRAERVDSLTVLYVNGQIEAAAISKGTIKAIEGLFTIGFDPTAVTENTPGRVMFVRFEKVHDMKIVASENADVTESGETETVPNELAKVDWIAAWEFNDSADAGRDFTGNGHAALSGNGSVTVADSVAHFDGASGFKVELADDLKRNSFVVEARVKPTAFATMQNILVAEPPGRYGDGWQLRADEGTLRVHFRDEKIDGTEWNIFAGDDLVLNAWNEIRLERSKDSLKLFQNGKLTVAAAYKGDVSQLEYDWGIGYDAMNQQYNTRYFEGDVDYIRFGALTALSAGSVSVQSPYVLLADWEFNDAAFPGLDKMANNTSKLLAGNAKIVENALSLDGTAGMPVALTKTFMRNDFVVEARIKPSAFGKMQNVVVAEPPGRYGDGWMLRVDDGILRVHLRDEDAHGTEWKIFAGKALTLGAWTEVRVERIGAGIKVFQDGELTVDETCNGDIGQLGYGLGIGFDAMYQAYHDRFFVGSVDYIRYYGVRK